MLPQVCYYYPPVVFLKDTPPKNNKEPDNDGWEDDFPVPGVYSS